MSTFTQLQTRVSSNVIDAPTAVQTNIPVFVNAAIEMIQGVWNFNCMKAEILGVPTTTSTTSHFLLTTPQGFKEPRGRPYWWAGSSASMTMMDWAPNRSYFIRQFQADKSTTVGPPTLLFFDSSVSVSSSSVVTLSSAITAGMPIGYYPYSDNLGPSTSQYPIYIPYWAILPDLANASDVNWFSTYMTECVVCIATRMSFEMDWDEQRAGYWQTMAFGPKWDGVDIKTAGGWFKVGLELDKRIGYAPIGTGT